MKPVFRKIFHCHRWKIIDKTPDYYIYECRYCGRTRRIERYKGGEKR